MWKFRTLLSSCHQVVRRRLHKAIHQKRTELWKNQSWILHHNNAHSSHIEASGWVFGQKWNRNHTSYSPDLAPAGFFLFPKLKTPLKGKRFAMIEEIKEKSKQELLVITKSAFQKCFDDWKKCWHKCIVTEGNYFEGDKIVIDK